MVGPIERRWRRSPSRRDALASLAALVAGSPLLAAQRDPRPLADHRRIPGFREMASIFDFEPVFRANVSQAVYDYTAHGADSEFTIRRNRDAFGWVDVVARPPVAPTAVDTRTTILGLSLDSPLFVAPSALQAALHPDGEVGMRGAAAAAKTPFIISNNSSQPAEKIATSTTAAPVWFQFYPRRSLDESRATLERVQQAGCTAIVVTVDQQATFYERTQHLRNLGGAPRGPLPRPGANAKNPYRVNDNRLWYEWPYLDQIRPFINGPMLVKGILTAEDARLCIEHGAQGIIVSNHGGRSLDYGPSTLEVLPEIVDAVGGRVPVLIDSGFRRGSDVMKAVALGANAVCLGRAARWGFGAFGPAGAQRVLEMIQAELVTAMAAAGRRSLAELDRTAVTTRFP
jgi:isopentenyl diphosphate isomerase/L-lactate dehydrogenase-like FMN-dependent dehydrogenase